VSAAVRASWPVVVAVAVLAVASPARAQWLNYPTPNVPRTAGGAPNLGAPAPRAADGRPDLSGMWEPEKNRPCPPQGCFDGDLAEHFMDIAWGLKGGLPYQPWAAALVKERLQKNNIDDPNSRCLPVGIVKNHTAPFIKKMIQVPGLVVILTEREVTYRQIFTDGRPLPVDPQPSFNGYSTGRWEGDVLVVRTTGFRDGIWLDRAGNPITTAATITERFRRPNYGHLEIEVTVDDPKAYTAPWTVTLKQHLVVDTELIDYYCGENERDSAHYLGK
jgi:hypothetical protein